MKRTVLYPLLAVLIWFIPFSNSGAQGINADTLIWENRASMDQARAYFPGLEFNGKLYAFGGLTGLSGSLFIITDEIEEYDVDGDTWAVKGALPQPMYGMATVELNGAIYIIGGSTDPSGFTASNKVYRYFPDSGAFDADTIASLPEARGFLSASALEGVIIATGGADGFLGVIKNDVYVYDPLLNRWITVQSLDQGIAGHTSINFGGTIFLIGGTSDWVNASNKVLSYDILTGLWWPQTNPLNHARVAHGSAVMGNTIYSFGGIASTINHELTVEEVTGILENTPWEVIGMLPFNRRAFGYASIEAGNGNSYIYIFGGNSSATTLNSTQRFIRTLVDVQEISPLDISTSKHSVRAMPNPFYGKTTLTYELKKSAQVILSIYGMNGKLVAQPVKTHQLPGEYKILFNGTSLEPGVYYGKFNFGDRETEIVKMVLLR